MNEKVHNKRTFVHIKHTRYSRDQISCHNKRMFILRESIISEPNIIQTQWRKVRDQGAVFIISGFIISDPDCIINLYV